MRKLPKWRIGISNTDYYMVEVEAHSEDEALIKALSTLDLDPDYWFTSQSQAFTGVFINDREASHYHPFVHDSLPESIEWN